MRMLKWTMLAAFVAILPAVGAKADMEAKPGGPQAGDWAKRTAVTPNPDKVVVPPGYKVGVFKAGLDTPSSAAVDKDDNLWVAISGPLFNTLDTLDPPHVKIFDKRGTLIKEVGRDIFKTVMNEIGYCAENDTMYIPEYGEKIWEMKGVSGELKLIVKDLPNGDHRNGGITCKDGYLYFALGFPSNTGFADPDNHGWTDIPNDPFWVKHKDGLGTTPHDPVCRDIVHTGLNVRSSDGRMTGALLPVGVPAKPGQVVKAQVPCGGSVMRVKFGDKDADGIYPHEKMEVYAMGFRNQSGVAFGPKGTKWENALAVSDNGANDLGHRRIANGAEKLWIVTEKGQDGGYPDKEGMNFVSNNNLFGAVYGILDTGPESLIPTWPLVLRIEFLEPTGVKWSRFAQNVDPGPNAYQKPENRGGLERPNRVVFSNDGKTMYVVDYGEVYTNFQMPTPFYTVAKSGVIWTITYTGGN